MKKKFELIEKNSSYLICIIFMMNKSKSLIYFKDSSLYNNNRLHAAPRNINKPIHHKAFTISIVKNTPHAQADHFESIGKLSHKRFSITKNTINLSKNDFFSKSFGSINNIILNCDQNQKENKTKTFIIQSIPKNDDSNGNSDIFK